jgi:hypothetical protein
MSLCDKNTILGGTEKSRMPPVSKYDKYLEYGRENG